jgi:hypothetical protein
MTTAELTRLRGIEENEKGLLDIIKRDEAEIKRLRDRIALLEKVLSKHRRYHGKMGCAGHPECYVCEAEEAALREVEE